MPCLPNRASTVGELRQGLSRSVAGAWRVFDQASRLPSRVTPAVPILFFGDLNAYWISPLRVLTVGLNPSLHEFPADEPFRRFPLAGDSRDREPDRYLDAMSAYFRTTPYRSWFAAFEPLLNGAGSSYYPGEAASTVLHTDICSPVATDPTWNKLGRSERAVLEADGRPLWHLLVAELRPHVLVLSVASGHLKSIGLAMTSGWEVAHAFEQTRSGNPRKRPYKVSSRWSQVGGEPCLLVFGPAAQKPFGLLSNTQKRETGALAEKLYRHGR